MAPPTPPTTLLLVAAAVLVALLPHSTKAISWNETFQFGDEPWNDHARVKALHDWMHVHATRVRWQMANLQERRARRPLRVLFVGDSTAREQNNFFCSAIDETFPSAVIGTDTRGPGFFACLLVCLFACLLVCAVRRCRHRRSTEQHPHPHTKKTKGHFYTCGSSQLNIKSAYYTAECTPDALAGRYNMSDFQGADVVYFNFGKRVFCFVGMFFREQSSKRTGKQTPPSPTQPKKQKQKACTCCTCTPRASCTASPTSCASRRC